MKKSCPQRIINFFFVLFTHFFVVRTSKFCRGSLFLFFGCFSLMLKFVLNLFLFLWAVWIFFVHQLYSIVETYMCNILNWFSERGLSIFHEYVYHLGENSIDIIINGKQSFCVFSFTVHIANVNYKIQ